MKKVVICSLGLVMFVLLFAVAIAASTNNTSGTSSVVSNNTSGVTIQQNLSKLDVAYSCLENKTKNRCSQLTTQEVALTVLAVPNSAVLTECRDVLKSRKTNQNCFGASSSSACNIRDTALAIIALNSLGENTDAYEKWLLTQNKTSQDLVWFLEQDSDGASSCTISYDSNDYKINVGSDKKIDAPAGPCLNLAQSNFWLQVSSNCYDKQFKVSCDKSFIATLLYMQRNSPTLFVLSDTPSKPAFGEIYLQIKAQCFGIGSSCDYEGSAWATLALLKTGHDVQNFIPYILASADSNKQYLPNAFVYMATSYEDYASKLIQQQQTGNYWLADSSAYDKFYDTAIAIIALRTSSAPQVTNAKNWLLFQEPSTGCWANSIRDTAAILWALTTRTPGILNNVTPSTSYCTQAGKYCIPNSECPSDQLLPNFYCAVGSICCQNENLKNCVDYGGKVCASGQECAGLARKALDNTACCLTDCQDIITTTECENQGPQYSCKSSCSSTEDKTDYACGSSDYCCKTKPVQPASKLWLWILIGIIVLVLAILFLLRDRIRLVLFKMKHTKDDDTPSNGPVRPGFPPIRPNNMPPRPMMPMTRAAPTRPVQTQQRPVQKSSSPMDDTFKKLREMSK